MFVLKKHKKKKFKKPTLIGKSQETLIGRIVDLPLEDFEKELIKQKVNIGTINNLILNLEGAYYELRTRKDAILDLVFKGGKSKDDPEIKKSLDGLYAEMIKIEQKITYLKQRSKTLLELDVDKLSN